MALFNFIMDDRNKRQRYAEQEVAPTLMELYEASNQPPGPAPTNTNLNVDLPSTQPMTQQGLLGGLMRAGAYPEVTKAALKAQMVPELQTIGGAGGMKQEAFVAPFSQPQPVGEPYSAGAFGGSSEFERNLAHLLATGQITPAEANEMRRKRVGTRSGLETSAGQDKTHERFQTKEYRVETEGLRDEWREDREHFSKMDQSISGAMAALEAGDNQLADQLLAQVMTQVNDTDVRAYQLITNMDQSYGNVAERTYRAVARFISGARTPEEKAEILKTLATFRESHVNPGTQRMDRRYRLMAAGRKLDPFDVVPPRSAEDIRDAPGLTKDQKIRALKKWYPDQFR